MSRDDDDNETQNDNEQERISYKLLIDLVTITEERERATRHLDESTTKRLEDILRRPTQPSINASKFGALANVSNTTRFATDEIVNNGILMLCEHCRVCDVFEITQTPYVLVDSQVLPGVLKRFHEKEQQCRQRGESMEQFDLADGFLKRNNLATLKERLTRFNARTLADTKGIDFVTFVLNWEWHWSLVVYSVADNDLTHFDSMGDLHQSRALLLYRLLRNVELIPEDAKMMTLSIGHIQGGNWQCGFAALAYAAWIGGTLPEIMHNPDIRVADVIENDEVLLQFIAALLERSNEARSDYAYAEARFEHLYQLQ